MGLYYARYSVDNYPKPKIEKNTYTPTNSDPSKINVIAEGLDTPWSMAFLPDKSLIFTERPGRVRLIDSGGVLKIRSRYGSS